MIVATHDAYFERITLIEGVINLRARRFLLSQRGKRNAAWWGKNRLREYYIRERRQMLGCLYRTKLRVAHNVSWGVMQTRAIATY